MPNKTRHLGNGEGVGETERKSRHVVINPKQKII